MSSPYQQEVILDADGQPIFTALKQVREMIAEINSIVAKTAATANKGVADYGNILRNQTKELQQSLAQIKTLATAKNTPGFAIQDLNANRRLAQATTQATEYGRGIASAATAVDALRAKLNELNREIAARGAAGKGETLRQTELRRGYEEQIRLIRQLDAEQARLERRASRLGVGVDNASVYAARARVEAAAMSQSRTNMSREISLFQGEIDKFSRAVAQAQGATARIAAQQRTIFQGQLAAAAGEVRGAVTSGSISPATALLGARFEQTLRQAELQKALAAGEAEQVRLARQALQIAEAKVRAAERLTREEQQQNEIIRRRGTATTIEQQRAQVLLAQQYAREQIQMLGAVEAVRRAKEATLMAEIKLNEALRIGTLEQQQAARAALQASQARQRATEQQGGSGGPLGTILSGRYALAAFARTSVYGAAAAAAYGLFNVLQNGLQNVVELEDAFAKLQAIADATGSQMTVLKGAIYEVASTSRFATLDLIKISQTLAQAGISAGQMANVLQAVTTLANASGSTPDEAVSLVTSALGAFQLQGAEAARVADLMTSALNRTKLTVAQTGQAIQYVGATAFEQNIGLEQLLGTIGAVAQAGVKSGSTIGTGFRQFLVDLQTPSEKLTEQLKLLGLSQADVDVKTRGLAAVLETLKNAGFGSAQAYQGLETRAAAFYLTAKNNIDVMDQLQVSFADQGAAARANERAMSSLTAQWQRLKNILGAGFNKEFGEPLAESLRDILRSLSDFFEDVKKLSERNQTEDGFVKTLNEWIKAEADFEDKVVEGFMNSSIILNDLMGTKFFDERAARAREAARAADEHADSEEQLATAISNTGDEISRQTALADELEKEYVRLLTQKDSLINNDQRSAAELTNLMGRFEGLSVYLTNTTNLYTDLTNAVRGFIAANQEALAGSISTQQRQLAEQSEGLRGQRGRLGNDVRNDPGFKNLPPAVQAAVSSVYSYGPGTDQFRRAIPVLNDYARAQGVVGTPLGTKIGALATNMQQGQSNQSTSRTLQTQRNSAEAASTTPGSYISSQISLSNALIAQNKPAEALQVIQGTRRYMGTFTALPQHQQFMNDSRAQLDSLENQVKAMSTPTSKELKAAKAAERAADAQAQLVTQSDIDSIVRGMNLPMTGRGHDESASARARQNAMKAAGLTKASADSSGHTMKGGVARDIPMNGKSFEEMTRIAAALEVRFREAGIPARVRVETGNGKNQGTGPHIHIDVKKGAKKRGSNSEATSQIKIDQYIDQKQLQLDQADLDAALKDMAAAVTTETFQAAFDKSKAALEKVNQDLRNQAMNELAGRGLMPGDPEWDVRMNQVEKQIDQGVAEFNGKVSEAIIKSLESALKAAQLRFEKAIAPAVQAKALADAKLSGLSYASNDGLVPDYVTTLAQRRAGQAAENVDRARSAALPAQIAAVETALAEAQQRLSKTLPGTAEFEKASLKVDELTTSLVALRNEKVNLDAALSASAQIPQTLGESLNQAIEAYKETHKLSNSFSQDLIMNMGKSLETVHSSFKTFFSDILSGTKSIGQAFGDMVSTIIGYLTELAAQWLANKAFEAILGASSGGGRGGGGGSFFDSIGSFFSGGGGGGGGGSFFDSIGSFFSGGFYDGGKVTGYARGGKVSNGSTAMDSVHAKLANSEWVINRRAAESVGDGFMAQLNAHGSKALDSLRGVPQIIQAPEQNTNVYVVAPDQKPSLTKNDILVTIQDDMLNGESRKLIKSISQGG